MSSAALPTQRCPGTKVYDAPVYGVTWGLSSRPPKAIIRSRRIHGVLSEKSREEKTSPAARKAADSNSGK
jgi:hypothetical protein